MNRRGYCKMANGSPDGVIEPCRAPAGIRAGGGGVGSLPKAPVARCTGCGEDVCTSQSCSVRTREGRLCLDCVEERKCFEEMRRERKERLARTTTRDRDPIASAEERWEEMISRCRPGWECATGSTYLWFLPADVSHEKDGDLQVAVDCPGIEWRIVTPESVPPRAMGWDFTHDWIKKHTGHCSLLGWLAIPAMPTTPKGAP